MFNIFLSQIFFNLFLQSAQAQFYRVTNIIIRSPLTLEGLLDSCNMLSESIPTNILATYISGQGDRQTISAIAEIVSSTQNTSAGGRRLNQFQYTSLLLKTRPPFLSFKFNEERLENTVKSKYPSSDFDAVLENLTSKLTSLRSIIYSIKLIEGVCDE